MEWLLLASVFGLGWITGRIYRVITLTLHYLAIVDDDAAWAAECADIRALVYEVRRMLRRG